MTATDAIKSAEQSGVTITKEKLIAMLKASARKTYPMAKHAAGALILVPVGNAMNVRS